MIFFKNLWKIIKKFSHSKNTSYILINSFAITLLASIFFICLECLASKIDPVKIIGLMLIILISSLLLTILLINYHDSNFFNFAKRNTRRVSDLRKRIIVAFSLGAAVPTIIVAVFSTYLFNFGVQSWFNEKLSRVLEQSIRVGESYLDEHILQLKDTAISISNDYADLYYKLIDNPNLFQAILSGQADFRSLDEAIVFKKDTNTILAQTALSFSLSFLTIPSYIFEKANKGEVVHLFHDPSKMRVLIKLYLLCVELTNKK